MGLKSEMRTGQRISIGFFGCLHNSPSSLRFFPPSVWAFGGVEMNKQPMLGKVYPSSVTKPRTTGGHLPRPPLPRSMSAMRELDSAFNGAGQKPGIEIWRIEKRRPVSLPKSSYGKFFTGDAYLILKTTGLRSGQLRHDIHYWLGKDVSQDEANAAAIRTVELDAALGGRAVQYREVQGNETARFLSYFKPCIIPQQGSEATGQEHETRLYVCKGKYFVHVKEVPFSRSSLNHDYVFILDTKSKIFQFNGSNSSIQERAKALEVVQHLKETYHDGKCEIAAVEDGKLMAGAEAGEFWNLFGGFAPLPKKASEEERVVKASPKLLRVEQGQLLTMMVDCLTRELLDSYKCYVLDCGVEVFVWMGRNTTLDERKSASATAESFLRGLDRPRVHIIRVIEGFESVRFRRKFGSWPQASDTTVSEDGRGKVAALLKRQGVNIKGLVKSAPSKDEPQAHIDCTGNLQVWHVDGQEKILIPSSHQFKFYCGECYIFQYNYSGLESEEILLGTWFGKKSVEEERAAAISMVTSMNEALKYRAVQARIYEGREPIQFFSIFQSFIVCKGGLSSGYKKYILENDLVDNTYSEKGIALFRVQGTGPENMQAIQVEPVASSLNSCYCYILHKANTIYTWAGSLTASKDQELVERQLDIIKPNSQFKSQKEGNEFENFWTLLGGRGEYSGQKITKDAESDPHLFVCSFSKGNLEVMEIYNFTQDDLMTEDMFILDNQSDIFVWVGEGAHPQDRSQALTIGEKFLESDFLLENLPRETPIFVIPEENEPLFFTCFFTWDSAKSAMHGNSFQRKLTIVKHGVPPNVEKAKRRVPAAYGRRTSVPTDTTQRGRSISFSPDRIRVRGRSPALNAIAAKFENPSIRNLSTPPPAVTKVLPKYVSSESFKLAPKSSTIASLSFKFERARSVPSSPKPLKAEDGKSKAESNGKVNDEMASSKTEAISVKEKAKEDDVEQEKGPIFPYERLRVDSTDPVPDVIVTKRETYLSSQEFRERFGMKKEAFFKLPKWKQNKMKQAVKLF